MLGHIKSEGESGLRDRIKVTDLFTSCLINLPL